MYLLVIFIPLLSALICCFSSRWIGSLRAWQISTTFLGVSFLLSCLIFYEIGLSSTVCTVEIGYWFNVGYFTSPWSFLYDSLTASMLIVVTSVSFLVHCYSGSYMEHDPHLGRFMGYLSLFTFFMLILVTGDNFMQLFLGWEGVGLSSYLLINFWFTRLQANKAAIKAMMVNRIGDISLTLGIALIYVYFKSVKYAVVFSMAKQMQYCDFYFLGYNWNSLDLICIFLLIAAVGKSAQLGLHTWLPDAMEGPTPVSALIHAATMVTAGVFLLVRCSPLYEHSSNDIRFLVVAVGALTAFFAATTGLMQHDLKKVIAYSTCSQLGYMVFACGLSFYSVSMFHLINHAFFKALLFLSAGSVIHSLSDEQDIRQMGGLVRLIPFTYIFIMIGSLSLMGFPFLTGFYSKDLILELAFSTFSPAGHFAFWMGSLAAFFTALYSFRIIYYVFIGPINGNRVVYGNVHDAPTLIAIPLTILGFASIFAGYVGKDLFVGLGTDFWGNSIYCAAANTSTVDAEFLPVYFKLIPVILSFIGVGTAYVFQTQKMFQIKTQWSGAVVLFNFLNRKWLFDRIYNEWVSQKGLWFGYVISYKTIDKGVLEYFGPAGLTHLGRNLSKFSTSLQTGLIFSYAFLVLLTVLLILSLTLFYFVELAIIEMTCVAICAFFIFLFVDRYVL